MPSHGSKSVGGGSAQSHNPVQSTIVPANDYQGAPSSSSPKVVSTTEDHAIGGTSAGKPDAGPGKVLVQD